MKRKMLALMLIVLCIFGMTACSSTPDPVGESMIKNDIMCQDTNIYNEEMHLSTFHITKRQTTPDQKRDHVWVNITAENEESRYVASCLLRYALYSEGWMLDDYEVLSKSFEYINGLDPAVPLARAHEVMDQYYSRFDQRRKGEIEVVKIALSSSRADCLVEHIEQMGTNGLLTLRWRFHIIYQLGKNGWSSGAWDGTMNVYRYDWNIVGEWKGSTGGENFYLKVHSYDEQAKSVQVEYAFGNRRSNGVETMYIVNQDFWNKEMKEWALSADKNAHNGFVDLYPYVKNYRDAGESSGILAESESGTHCWLSKVE